MRITDQLFKDDEPKKTRPMGSQILIYLASNIHNGATSKLILPAWSQLGLLKGTSKNQKFYTYRSLQKNALRRQRV